MRKPSYTSPKQQHVPQPRLNTERAAALSLPQYNLGHHPERHSIISVDCPGHYRCPDRHFGSRRWCSWRRIGDSSSAPNEITPTSSLALTQTSVQQNINDERSTSPIGPQSHPPTCSSNDPKPVPVRPPTYATSNKGEK